MIAYYVHWKYPATADIELFYNGVVDEKFFHKEENAIKYAKEQLKQWRENERDFDKLNKKNNEKGLSHKEKEEWAELGLICCGYLPNGYTIRKREIKFEDED